MFRDLLEVATGIQCSPRFKKSWFSWEGKERMPAGVRTLL